MVFPGGRAGPSKWPPEAVFSQLCCGFYKKLLHRAILIVRAYADALQIFKIMESTTKLVTAHAESIFQLRLCDFKNRDTLVWIRTMGTQDRIHECGSRGLHSWSSTRIAIKL